MAVSADHAASLETREQVGRWFVTLGRIGVWGQMIPLIIGFVLAAYVVGVGGQTQSQRYIEVGNVVSLAFFLIPVFTTFWCMRYMKVGRLMSEGDDPPSWRAMRRTAWIGVIAGVTGAVLSLLFLFGAVLNLLYVLVSTPQVGLMVAPAAGGEGPLSVSAIDAVSLLSILITLTTELLMVWLSLWLVFAVREQAAPSAVP